MIYLKLRSYKVVVKVGDVRIPISVVKRENNLQLLEMCNEVNTILERFKTNIRFEIYGREE